MCIGFFVKMPRKPQPRNEARGRRVAELREALLLSQEKLAHEVGVAGRTLQNWEAGGTISDPARLATVLQTTVGYIMTGEDRPSTADGDAEEVVDRLSRQQEILRRVASNRLLTAEQLEFLERALDELEHGTRPAEAPTQAEGEAEVA